MKCCYVVNFRTHCKGYWALPYSRVSSPSTSRSASLSRHSLEVVLTRTEPEETQDHVTTHFVGVFLLRPEGGESGVVCISRVTQSWISQSQNLVSPSVTSLQVRCFSANLQGILFCFSLDWKVQWFSSCQSVTLSILHWMRSCAPMAHTHTHTLICAHLYWLQTSRASFSSHSTHPPAEPGPLNPPKTHRVHSFTCVHTSPTCLEPGDLLLCFHSCEGTLALFSHGHTATWQWSWCAREQKWSGVSADFRPQTFSQPELCQLYIHLSLPRKKHPPVPPLVSSSSASRSWLGTDRWDSDNHT